MPSREEPPRHFQFGSVEVDVARSELRVHGRVTECQPLSFRLLVLLCEARGAVVAKEDLIQRLWPDQVVVSDESLTQVVHRLRQALGDQGAAIKTVRKIGLRLDLVVEVSRPAEALGPPVSPATAADGGASPPRRTGRGAWVAAVAALLAVVGIAGIFVWQRHRAVVTLDDGYALTSADLGARVDETETLVRRAFAAEAAGNRGEAVNLLQSASASDSASAVVPTLLSLWQSYEDSECAVSVALAESRLSPTSTPYQRLLVLYARRRLTGTDEGLASVASALLELRPAAWRFRLARAHYNLARRENQAALNDLRLIPITAVRNRNLALVLADRASLGDADGAERDLAASRSDPESPLALYVRGRIAWSRDQPRLARQLFERGASVASGGQPDAAQENRSMAALMALVLGDPDTAAVFDQVAAHGKGESNDASYFEARVQSAVANRAASGDEEFRRRMGQAAALIGDRLHLQAAWSLLAMRFGVVPPWDLRALGDNLESPELLGVRELLLARAALRDGHADVARRYLAEAQARGVERSYFAEDSLLLAADLGAPARTCKVDPPYPDSFRFLACAELARRSTAGRPVT